MSDQNEQLLPCAHCGGTNLQIEGDGGICDYVMCGGLDRNGCGMMVSRVDCEGDPREAWNRRAPAAAPAPVAANGNVLEQARGALNVMIKQFTRTPSTGADSQARGLGHAAIAAIDAALAAAQQAPAAAPIVQPVGVKTWQERLAESAAWPATSSWVRAAFMEAEIADLRARLAAPEGPVAITDEKALNGIKWYAAPPAEIRNGVNLYAGPQAEAPQQPPAGEDAKP